MFAYYILFFGFMQDLVRSVLVSNFSPYLHICFFILKAADQINTV